MDISILRHNYRKLSAICYLGFIITLIFSVRFGWQQGATTLDALLLASGYAIAELMLLNFSHLFGFYVLKNASYKVKLALISFVTAGFFILFCLAALSYLLSTSTAQQNATNQQHNQLISQQITAQQQLAQQLKQQLQTLNARLQPGNYQYLANKLNNVENRIDKLLTNWHNNLVSSNAINIVLAKLSGFTAQQIALSIKFAWSFFIIFATFLLAALLQDNEAKWKQQKAKKQSCFLDSKQNREQNFVLQQQEAKIDFASLQENTVLNTKEELAKQAKQNNIAEQKIAFEEQQEAKAKIAPLKQEEQQEVKIASCKRKQNNNFAFNEHQYAKILASLQNNSLKPSLANLVKIGVSRQQAKNFLQHMLQTGAVRKRANRQYVFA